LKSKLFARVVVIIGYLLGNRIFAIPSYGTCNSDLAS
jgi:hypothetical protein